MQCQLQLFGVLCNGKGWFHHCSLKLVACCDLLMVSVTGILICTYLKYKRREDVRDWKILLYGGLKHRHAIFGESDTLG